MKKLMNKPTEVVRDMFAGIEKCYGGRLSRVAGLDTVFLRRGAPVPGRVGVLLGGGSGHEPMFIGFLGEGLADVVVQGNVFASPFANLIFEAAKAVNSGAGVLFIHGNYAGDIMNFNMAEGMCAGAGIQVRTVRVSDDISTGPDLESRRGVTADLYTVKTAGAAAALGLPLEEVARAALKAMLNCRTLGIGLTPGTLPETGLATFELSPDEIEVGMGAHGEAGIRRSKLTPARKLAAFIMEKIVEDFPLDRGDEVALMVNGAGSTTMMELFIMAKEAHEYLEGRGIRVWASDVGEFLTTQEMGGCHLMLMRLDDELKKYYLAPCDSICYTRCA